MTAELQTISEWVPAVQQTFLQLAAIRATGMRSLNVPT